VDKLPGAFLDKELVSWFRYKITDWAEDNLRAFPWRQTTDPYAIFIAEFLLQQTDAPKVVPIYNQFLKLYPSLNDLAGASLDHLTTILQPLGLHYRSLRIYKSAQLLVSDLDFNGKIPQDYDALQKLYGVGKYMAGSICANAFGQPIAVIDTNIARILQRFFGLKPRRTRAREDAYFWDAAQKIAPPSNVGRWNLSLIDFGTAMCTFRKPRCIGCPLQKKCLCFSISDQN